MQVQAIAKNIGISPRKVRLITNAVKGMHALKAIDSLQFMPQAAATPVRKLISSAVANAENNYNLDAAELYILNIISDEARNLKRGRMASKGRMSRITKRSSHITVIVSDDRKK